MRDFVYTFSPAVRALFGPGGYGACLFAPICPEQAGNLRVLHLPETSAEAAVEAVKAHKGEALDAVCVENTGAFAVGAFAEDARRKLAALSGKGVYAAPADRERYAGTELGGRVILVTGGAQGFGEGIVRALAAAGAQVLIADINLERGERLAEELCSLHGADAAAAVYMDVTREDSVIAAFDQVAELRGGLDGIVSNAGITRVGSLEEISLETFEMVFRINTTGYFLVAKYGSRLMKKGSGLNGNYGDIVVISSKSGLFGHKFSFTYCGSKHAVMGMTDSMAKELIEYNIKVNAVCPGNYYGGPMWNDPETGLFAQYYRAGRVPGAKSVEEVKENYFRQEAFHRGVTPEDVALAVIYCIRQQYETGRFVTVSGGRLS